MPERKSKITFPTKEKESTVKMESVVETSSVYFEKSVTKNMGDYNSAKITIGVTIPTQPSSETLVHIQETIELADEIVTTELEKQVKDLLG